MPSTQTQPYAFLLNGELRAGPAVLDVRSPYSGDLIGRASLAGCGDVTAAIDAAVAAAPAAAAMPSHARAAVLDRISAGVVERKEELAGLLAAEAGKPVRLAYAEIDRAAFVFRQGAEEAKRIGGEVIPMDLAPHGEKRWGLTRRFPLSPISAIIPFNFPVLLAAHKLAPAIACGATMVLKPPPQDPLATLLLAEIVQGSGYPAGALSILLCTNDDAAPILDDPRVRMVTFTGSARVGWTIRQRAPKKRVTLELGGNAAVLVEPDADIDHAVQRCVTGGYLYAGQSCISTQRILVHESVYERVHRAIRRRGRCAPHRRSLRRHDRRRPDDRRGERRAGRGMDRRGGGRRREARRGRRARPAPCSSPPCCSTRRVTCG